jgi:hypothetical protein
MNFSPFGPECQQVNIQLALKTEAKQDRQYPGNRA